jgi:hypothetical protein
LVGKRGIIFRVRRISVSFAILSLRGPGVFGTRFAPAFFLFGVFCGTDRFGGFITFSFLALCLQLPGCPVLDLVFLHGVDFVTRLFGFRFAVSFWIPGFHIATAGIQLVVGSRLTANLGPAFKFDFASPNARSYDSDGPFIIKSF